ncbi:MAG: SLC13 family permease [Gemmatimonadetes bacterium]|nr:SLC13 family permease [Gemmatimonadota bacterium]
MPLDRIEVLAVLALALALFVTEKVRVDLVSLIVLALLLVLGLVTPKEGVSGFSNEATVTVAAMFVLSGALKKVGGLDAVAAVLVRAAERGRSVLLGTMMGIVSAVSAFINNTACVAVFLPIALTVARRAEISPSRLLIPLSYAAQFGGVVTLIGTSTNVLVASLAVENGLAPLGMFEFAPLGLTLAAVGIVYMLFIGQRLLPDRGSGDLTTQYALADYLTELVVRPGSRLIGQPLSESGLSQAGINVVQIVRDGRAIWAPSRAERVAERDVIVARSSPERILLAKDTLGLEIRPEVKFSDERLQGGDAVLAEVLIAPGSHVEGSTLESSNFRGRFRVIVMAIHRRAEIIREELRDVVLRSGDVLLVVGHREDVGRLGGRDDFILLRQFARTRVDRRRVALVLATIAGVILAAAVFDVPIVLAALVGSIGLVVSGCLNLEEAYEAIDWQVIFLLAGILPLGIALEQTGTAAWVAAGVVAAVGDLGPIWVLGALYFFCALLNAVISNNAAAVLMIPIAISTAVGLGVDPRPFVFAIAYAGSSDFATPIGYQTNTMIYGPGGYRFLDYTRVGAPLILLFMLVTTLLAPRIWPF